jgi:hypothetical protein
MNVVLVILKDGKYIISVVEELEYEPKCHMIEPLLVSEEYTFTLWPSYTDDRDILIHTTDILTVCEPAEKLKTEYLDKIGKTEEDLTPKPNPVILNESADPDDVDWDDEYEPFYTEENT